MRRRLATLAIIAFASWAQAAAENLAEHPVLLASAEARCAAIGFSLATYDSDDREAWARRASDLFQRAGIRLMEVIRTEKSVDTLEKYGNLSEFYARHPDFVAGIIVSGIFEDVSNEMSGLEPREQRAAWRVRNCDVIAAIAND